MFNGTSPIPALIDEGEAPCMTRLALIPLPGSSRPWGSGNSRQRGEKAPGEREGVETGAVGPGERLRGERRVDG